MNVLKGKYRNKEVKVVLEETESGVIVNIEGVCSVFYNNDQLINSKEEGIMKTIPNSMIDWVNLKSENGYKDKEGIDFINGFTLYPFVHERGNIVLRHWLFSPKLMKENDINETTIKDLEKDLLYLNKLFTNKIKLVYSHNSDTLDDFYDISFNTKDFDFEYIDTIMLEWLRINRKYMRIVY